MKIVIGNNGGREPIRGTEEAAGLDLFCTETVIIPRYNCRKIKTDIKVEIPDGHFGMLCPRSSMGKRGLSLANTIGIIDSDYRGEIICLIRNNNSHSETVKANDRIAQLVIVPYISPKIEVVRELSETDRGTGGFGSTGE